MEYSLLIAEDEDGNYQPIEMVSSQAEIDEAVANYIKHGPDCNWIAPYIFTLWSRNSTGGYALRKNIVA